MAADTGSGASLRAPGWLLAMTQGAQAGSLPPQLTGGGGPDPSAAWARGRAVLSWGHDCPLQAALGGRQNSILSAENPRTVSHLGIQPLTFLSVSRVLTSQQDPGAGGHVLSPPRAEEGEQSAGSRQAGMNDGTAADFRLRSPGSSLPGTLPARAPFTDRETEAQGGHVTCSRTRRGKRPGLHGCVPRQVAAQSPIPPNHHHRHRELPRTGPGFSAVTLSARN